MNSSNTVANQIQILQIKINQLIDQLQGIPEEDVSARAPYLEMFYQACDVQEELQRQVEAASRKRERQAQAEAHARQMQAQAEAEAHARQMHAEAHARFIEDAKEELELIDLQRHKSMRRWDIAEHRKKVLADIRSQRTSVEDLPRSMTLHRVRFGLNGYSYFSSESTSLSSTSLSSTSLSSTSLSSTSLSSSLEVVTAPIDNPSTERLPSPPKSCLKRKKEEATTEQSDSSEPSEKRYAP
jgi:hypothetical protein